MFFFAILLASFFTQNPEKEDKMPVSSHVIPVVSLGDCTIWCHLSFEVMIGCPCIVLKMSLGIIKLPFSEIKSSVWSPFQPRSIPFEQIFVFHNYGAIFHQWTSLIPLDIQSLEKWIETCLFSLERYFKGIGYIIHLLGQSLAINQQTVVACLALLLINSLLCCQSTYFWKDLYKDSQVVQICRLVNIALLQHSKFFVGMAWTL